MTATLVRLDDDGERPFAVVSGAHHETAGGLVAAGRVRLDGREALRSALGLPADADDLALAAAAVERWDADAATHLRGDFALAAWDGERRRLHLLRDPLGAAALYLRRQTGSLFVSTSTQLLRVLPPRLDDLDEESVADFLLFGEVMHPERTAVAGLERLPPGSTLTLAPGAERRETRHDLATLVADTAPPDDPVERFRTAFDAAVADRLPATGPVGAWMSDGLDGALVAATAAGVHGADVRGYTWSWPRLVGDGVGERAAAAGAEIGVPVSVEPVDDLRPWTGDLQDPARPIHEPFFAVACRLAERAAADGCGVILTGEGADDLCWATGDDVVAWARSQPLAATAAVARRVLERRGLPGLRLRGALARRFGRGGGWRPSYPTWLHPDLERRLDLPARWRAVTESPPVPGRRGAALTSLLHPRSEAVHRWYDAVAAATGVRFLHPFLDRRVAGLLLALPPLPWAWDKRIVRAAARGRLSDAVRLRPKRLLPTEPLLAHLADPTWSPPARLVASPALDRFVDRRAWAPRLAAAGPLDAWADTRPISLAGWLER
ncbi:MAG TPA: asparagine synthase-related protein [Thermoanaerobaculia bacterium]|nr:asparagine synthase-related protein [Thermoanaerobaculia bacterium]